ncbi:MAG: TrbC/VirB2 family protein [Alphaproteobacteria bacterium]
MKTINWLKFSFLLVAFMLISTGAYAGEEGAIFDKLALRAQTLGGGLRKVGYIIAAFGLIVFSFMAIFNKISWKNLAYIMMSCFILTFMAMLINEIGSGGVQPPSLSFDGASGGGNANNGSQDPMRNQTNRGGS